MKENVQELQNTVTEMIIKMIDLENRLDKIMKANVTKEITKGKSSKNMEDITELSITQNKSVGEKVKVLNKVTKEKENSKLADLKKKEAACVWKLKKNVCPVINVTSNV